MNSTETNTVITPPFVDHDSFLISDWINDSFISPMDPTADPLLDCKFISPILENSSDLSNIQEVVDSTVEKQELSQLKSPQETLLNVVNLESPVSSPQNSTMFSSPFNFSQISAIQMMNFLGQHHLESANKPLTPSSPVKSHTSDPCLVTNHFKSLDEPQKMTASEKKRIREYARNLTCFNCHTSKTPLWRRTSDKLHNLCNACGLFFKQYKSHRPIAYKDRSPRTPKRAAINSHLWHEVIQNVSQSTQSSVPLQGTITLNWAELQALLNAAKS